MRFNEARSAAPPRKKMKKTTVIINGPGGLHMRTAAEIITSARRVGSTITFVHKNKRADTTSILEMLSLEASSGAMIEVFAEGGNE
jgi:phosphotransferase system HPr (HPr) family protein